MLPEILRTGKTACTFDRKNRGQLFLACIVTSLKKTRSSAGAQWGQELHFNIYFAKSRILE